MGAVAAEMFTGLVLFQNDSVATMLCRISGILGPFPKRFLKRCTETRKYLLDDGTHFQLSETTKGEVEILLPKATTLASRLGLSKYALKIGHYEPQSLNLGQSRKRRRRQRFVL